MQFSYVISTLSSTILSNISYLAQRSMYLKFYLIFQIYPTYLRYVYCLTDTILAILYREVPHMLHAKYWQNQPSESGEEIV